MTRDRLEQYYDEAVEFVVDVCLARPTRKASLSAWRDKLSRGGHEALLAQGEMRAALHDYYGPRLRPVRIDTTTKVVILDRSGKWVRKNRKRLGYDEVQPVSKRYDYDCVCSAVGERPAQTGMRCIFFVDGKEVVGTLLRINAFASIGDALNSGVRLREMSMEQALAMPWADHDDRAVWGRAYIKAIGRLIDTQER